MNDIEIKQNSSTDQKDEKLKSFIERIERLEEEKNNITLDIKDAVGDKLEIILDGGVRRGTHVLKALSIGATACSFGKGFLFGLGAGGQAGVEQVLKRMREELRRDMILLGCKTIKELNKSKIAYRGADTTTTRSTEPARGRLPRTATTCLLVGVNLLIYL